MTLYTRLKKFTWDFWTMDRNPPFLILLLFILFLLEANKKTKDIYHGDLMIVY